MRLRHWLLIMLALGALSFWAQPLRADDNSSMQFNGRIGLISASYSGPQIGTGEFNLPNGLDLEAEYFVNNRRSYLLRTTLGLDQKTSSVRYTYTGIGERFFLFSRGLSEEFSSDGLIVKAVPKWRFYVGGDAGLSQMLVLQLNSILGTYVSLIEASACAGVIYQVTHDVGFEAHVDYGMGFGYTNVSATTTNARFFLGLSLYL